MIAWHDGCPGVDGQASSSTGTRRVLRAGNHPGKEILRAHFEFLHGKGKARRQESHYPQCQARRQAHHLTPRVDKSRMMGPPEVTSEEGNPR